MFCSWVTRARSCNSQCPQKKNGQCLHFFFLYFFVISFFPPFFSACVSLLVFFGGSACMSEAVTFRGATDQGKIACMGFADEYVLCSFFSWSEQVLCSVLSLESLLQSALHSSRHGHAARTQPSSASRGEAVRLLHLLHSLAGPFQEMSDRHTDFSRVAC